jgi:DNA repair protein SbcD/Mre11
LKILHTADWHLGRKFLGRECEQEEVLFIDCFLKMIEENNVDTVLISGDVFDSPNPPIYAEKNYFYFLKKVVDVGCDVFITSGNHDSKRKLLASYQILEDNPNVYITTESKRLQSKINSNVTIAAIPFLTMNDLEINPSGKTFSDVEKEVRLKTKEIFQAMVDPSKICIGMGHLSIFGFSMNQSGGIITSSDYGAVSTSDVNFFNYLAMGHLHKSQVGEGNIVYSGSPFSCNFGESLNDRSVVLVSVDTKDVNKTSYEFLDVPKFKDVVVFSGTVEQIEDKIENYFSESELGCFGSIVFDEELSDSRTREILDLAKSKEIEILKYSLQKSNFEFKNETDFVLDQTPKEIFMSLVNKSDPEEYVKYKKELSSYFDIVQNWKEDCL